MHNKTDWQLKLQSIDVIHRAGLLSWEPIHSGTSNRIFKVLTEVGTWVVRFNRAALGIDRFEEKLILDLIEPLKIGPKVIQINPDEGYLITEFIEQTVWQKSDFKNQDNITLLKNSMQKYHAIEYSFLPSRLDHRLKAYLKKIENVPEQTTIELLNTIQKLDFLGFWQANKTLFHSDLNLNNLMGNNPLTIIDWEFAGQGHPLLDWIILERETKTNLSEHYPEDINPSWITPAKSMIRAMMKLWPHESP